MTHAAEPVPTVPLPATPVVPGQPTRKVTAASVGTWLGGVALLAILQAVGAHPLVLPGLPDWVDVLVAPLVPAAVAFVSGYVTKHAPNDVQLPTTGA
jgi:hypothetical protein